MAALSVLTRTKPNLKEANQEEENHKPISLKDIGYPDLAVHFYKGFFCPALIFRNVLAFQNQFQPLDTDVIVASKPKSGTTWLKSLVFSILYRNDFDKTNHPLLTKNSHELAPNFEYDVYAPLEEENAAEKEFIVDGKALFPRLFSTHLPYGALPESMKSKSKCKLVYVARNPYDTLVSWWKFVGRLHKELTEEVPLEDFVEGFSRGVEAFGPHWDHVLGYWKESQENPGKVLFLKYEDMKKDGAPEIKRLAKFLGRDFTPEEESNGAVEEILKFCSIDNLKNLEVNKNGDVNQFVKNNIYFRKGVVGDWANHLSPSMYEKMNAIMKEKFAGSGLEFEM